jgi:hypothetical protein
MPHSPVVPKGSTSPYPLSTPQFAQRAEIKHDLAEQAASTLERTVDRRAGGLSRLAIGIAVGSAAIAAGLFFTRRVK